MNKRTPAEWVFTVCNTVLMILLCVITLYPFYYCIVASVSDTAYLNLYRGILLTPQHFTMAGYERAFSYPTLFTGFRNTLIILALGLPINLVLTLCCGYALAAKNMYWKKLMIGLTMFTKFFGGGMIPAYLNVKDLGLYNTFWSLVLPGALSVYNAIIVKTAIENVPESLSESAYIDGANDILVLFRIILPLIMPTMAVMLLYYGVGHWNSWFAASIYLKDNARAPLQLVLRAILIQNSDLFNVGSQTGDTVENSYTQTIKYGCIVISTVPVLLIYPFVQKYFTKGVMIGAVKG